MRVHQLDANGVIINTIIVESLDALPGLVADMGGQIGDQIIDGVLHSTTPTREVPGTVTRRQARQALLLNGMLDKVQPAIDALTDTTQRGMAQIEWDDSLDFERTRPLVIQIGTAIGLDSVGLDALFIQAAGL